MAVDVFSVPVFLVVFRETIETAIIVSILFAFLKQTLGQSDADKKVYKKLARQIWLGTAIGFLICVIVAAAIIATFYTAGRDAWGKNEDIYEGVFCLIASIIITIMGVALLRIGRLREKWRVKLTQAMENPVKVKFGKTWLKQFLEKHALFLLPFITILREGIEAVVFVAGVSFSAPASAIPLPAIVGLLAGSAVGYMLYKGGSSTKIQLFLVASTCLLYIVAAGLFSRAVWSFEAQQWNTIVGGDAAELGSGPGSYDITKSVWHVDCCSPNLNGGGGWGILQAIFGWTNSATYGSVISYNVYWIFVIIMFIVLRFHEKNGRYPFFKAKSGHRDQNSAVRVVSGGQSPSDDSIAGDKRLESTVGKI